MLVAQPHHDWLACLLWQQIDVNSLYEILSDLSKQNFWDMYGKCHFSPALVSRLFRDSPWSQYWKDLPHLSLALQGISWTLSRFQRQYLSPFLSWCVRARQPAGWSEEETRRVAWRLDRIHRIWGWTLFTRDLCVKAQNGTATGKKKGRTRHSTVT